MGREIAFTNVGLAKEQFSKLMNRLAGEPIADADEKEHGRLVLAALLFCEQSCAMTQEALAHGCWLHEMVMVRPVLETSVRLLFAVRVPDGWRRYQRYWAEQDREWATVAKEQLPSRPSGNQWLADADERLSKLPVAPMNYKLNKALRAILDAEREIARATGSGGPPAEEDADVAHLLLFKLAHHVTHGSPEYLLKNLDAHLSSQEFETSGVLFSQCAYLMTRAVYLLREWPDLDRDAGDFIRRTKRPRCSPDKPVSQA